MVRSGTLRLGTLLLISAAVIGITCPQVCALIMGGVGNSPVRDPGWPTGASAIFNVASRIAWWEGPPFGGGQWHAECRGDAMALNAVLVDFKKLDAKTKRIVVHDGVGRSFWLNPNDEPAKRAAAKMDWSFTVWQPEHWEHLRKLPADLNPTDAGDRKGGPPAQIEIYTGGNIKWADVRVPDGLTVVDERLQAHGFTSADGTVLEGEVVDLATQKPVAAKVRLESIEPQRTGGYRYSPVAHAAADAEGHWVLKKASTGWYRIIAESAGYVPRVLGYLKIDDQPHWLRYDTGLARPAVLAGRVIDNAGQPLATVEVRVQDLTTNSVRYESSLDLTLKTGMDGRFRSDQIPVGQANLWVYKPGYCRPGLGLPVTMPNENVELKMSKSARVVVTVDFTGKERPVGFIVSITPERGDAVGTYGGSGQINKSNQMIFENVPPGRYVMRGQPNPASADQRTEPVTVDLAGGKTEEVTLRAK
jgi:hypothetical protein